MSREKQIEEMVKTLSTCECDCLKCKTCYSWKLCETLYNADYRKQSEGEWLEIDDGVLIGEGKHLECSKCGTWRPNRQRVNYCSNCGAKMKGGME